MQHKFAKYYNKLSGRWIPKKYNSNRHNLIVRPRKEISTWSNSLGKAANWSVCPIRHSPKWDIEYWGGDRGIKRKEKYYYT